MTMANGYTNPLDRLSRMALRPQTLPIDPVYRPLRTGPLPSLPPVNQQTQTDIAFNYMDVKVTLTSAHALPPTTAKDGLSGIELYCAHSTIVSPGTSLLIPTDVVLQIPPPVAGRVLQRNEAPIDHNLEVFRTAVPSEHYRPVSVNVFNHGDYPIFIPRGVKIALVILQRNYHPIITLT